MPIILLTANEVIDPILATARQLSDEIIKLSDLEKCPLNPGESPDARRHKIASLGRRLAVTFIMLDDAFTALVSGNGTPTNTTTPPQPTDPQGAN